MIPDRIWTAIEDTTFTASLGVVSTPRAFDAAISRQPPVIELLSLMEDSDNSMQVLTRVRQLLETPEDARYCHPFDLPVAIYIRALDICNPQLAADAAEIALQLPNLWWSRAMALRVTSLPARRIPVQWEKHVLATFDPVILREERAPSPGYSFPMYITWKPAVQATFGIATDAANRQVDLSPSQALVRVRALGVAA